MIRFLAIDFNQEPAAAVVARLHPDKPIEIVALGQLQRTPQPDSEEQPSDDSAPDFAIDFPDGGFDRALALMGTNELVYSSVDLPFSDPKKISQVVPLQLQDSLPFDISECVLDMLVTPGSQPTSYRVFAALSPSENVAQRLKTMSTLGVDPLRISTHASVLAELLATVETQGSGLQAIVNIQQGFVALAILHVGVPCAFREWRRIPESEELDDLPDVLAEVRASISGAEAEQGVECSKVYVLGSDQVLARCRAELRLPVSQLSLNGLVENHTSDALAIDRYCWAIGLAAQERQQLSKAKGSFDFRKGIFAYQRAWSGIWEALAHEATWIALALLFGIGYFAVDWWAGQRQLNLIENEIARLAQAAAPGETVPARGEIQFFEQLVEDRENQLREMGSLASLSPLESLRVLSTAIPPTVSVEVQSITIGFSRILLRGVVADTPTLGTLESVLKAPAQQFCSVKVDPQGREAGTSRVNFVAEIEVCE